jgi:hypothetical protein
MYLKDLEDDFLKELNFLDRLQAVLYLYIIKILATVQEHGLKREPVINNFCQLSLQLDINAYAIGVIV